jgi:hypothetical protein
MKFVVIDTAVSGNTTLVAAVPNRKIRVVSYLITAHNPVDVYFSSSGTTALTGVMPLTKHFSLFSGGGAQTPSGLTAQFETRTGESLVLHLASSVQTVGHLTYQVL